MEPTAPLFNEFFYINRQTEFTDGPYLELGGSQFNGGETILSSSHPKGWIKTRFYCKNTASASENPLPGYRADRLPMDFIPQCRVIPEEHDQAAPAYSKLRALLANGLTGVDLTRCWLSWRILPLSHRSDLMCNYSRNLKDPNDTTTLILMLTKYLRLWGNYLERLNTLVTKWGWTLSTALARLLQ